MAQLRQKQNEFTAITENMSEGFLVIDQETRVLTYNSAVLRLLYAQVPTEEGGSVYAEPGGGLPPLRGGGSGRSAV